MFLKANEYRISIIGFLILMTLTIVTGISVYVVMQRQAELILGKSLEAELKSSVDLIDSQIAQGMVGTQMLATRPHIIHNLLQINATPGDLKGHINLQRTAESFIPNSFGGMSFYDARGTEVARSGLFLQNPAMHVFLNTQHSAYLFWDKQFMLHTNTDILDQHGRRIGSVMTEAILKLPYAFADAASIGHTGEFALCTPLEEDPKSMDCLLSGVSGKTFKRLQRVLDNKALPMNYALDGKSGLIFAKDYRGEKVVAAYSAVGKLGLGMVLKIDQSELYSSVTGQLKYIAALLLALIVLGGLLLYSMVTPLVRQLLAGKQALQSENEKNLALLHNASDGISILDAQGNVIEVSDSFCAMLGYRREEMTGMNVLQWDAKLTAAELGQFVGQQLIQKTRVEFQTLYRRKDGGLFSVEVSSRALELGGKPALFNSSRDITERKRLEEEKAEALNRLEKIASRVPGMLYQYLLSTDGSSSFPFVSEGIRGIYRVSPEEVYKDATKAFSIIHPHDLEGVVTSIRQSAQDLTLWHYEYRVRLKEGTVRWLLGNAMPQREADGSVLWHGFITDITERKEYEKRILDNEKNLLGILKLSPIAVRIAIHNGRDVVFFNEGYTKLIKSTNPLGDNPQNYYAHSKDYQDILFKLDQGEAIINQEVELSIPGGTTVWALCSYMPMQYRGEKAVLGWFYDITERKLMEEQIQQLAFYDALTKLPNRRLLDDRLSQAMTASKRSGHYGALMFLDLDNFKPINDIHGHGVGDLLLIEAASRLKNCVREVDTVARFGGDEFVVMLSELDADKTKSNSQAALIAEKIRAALSELYLLTIKHEGQADIHVEHRCTVSVGVVLFVSHEVSKDDLVKMADTAMYQAKESGRNQIRFYLAEA